MSKTLVNLTLPVIRKTIAEVLETYPHHPYQQAFAHPDMRAALIAYVLNQVSSHYAVVDEQQGRYADGSKYYLEETLHLEDIVHQGIVLVWREYAEQMVQLIPEEVPPNESPANWFG